MLEKELMSIVTLQRRFSLASAATWMYLLALQMFLLAEMVVLDECSVHILSLIHISEPTRRYAR